MWTARQTVLAVAAGPVTLAAAGTSAGATGWLPSARRGRRGCERVVTSREHEEETPPAAMLAPGLPTEWARLHPLSPVVRSARLLFALAIVVLPRQLTPGQHQSPWVDV